MGVLAEGRPKHLLPVGPRLAVDFAVDAVDRLSAVGEIHVLSNERFRPDFEAWAARRVTRAPLRVHSDGVTRREDSLGAVGDIQWFLEHARGGADTLVLAGDNVFDFHLDELVRSVVDEPTVALYETGSLELVRRYATVELDGRGRVTRFVEKDPAPRVTLGAVAIYGFPHHALPAIGRYLAGGGAPDNMGHLIEWLHREMPVRGVVMEGRWCDVGSPDEYARVQREFA